MTVPTITKIDAVLTKLEAIAKAALEGVAPKVVVMDGPQLGEPEWRHFMLGISDTPETPPYTTHYVRQEGLGRPRYVEEWEIRCELSLADGSNDVAALRTEAAALLGLLDSAVRDAHAGEGVPWVDAGLGDADMRWYLGPTPEGATVLVFFSIEGSALL